MDPLSLRHPCTRAALAAALALAGCLPSYAAGDAPSSPFWGLELVPSKNVAALYRSPDSDLSAYGKILIGEPTVEFAKNWNPRNYGTYGLSAAQLTKMRADIAALAKSTFAQVLSAGGYEIVTEAGDGVLLITPNIVNVFISAPDVQSAGRTKTFSMEAGSATLALQVNDAVTGTLLAVVLDSKRSGQSTLRWTTGVSNRAAAAALLKNWAEQLKRELDEARAKY
jgi:hypothetical protein